jgi:hypothetical protein
MTAVGSNNKFDISKLRRTFLNGVHVVKSLYYI